jgi:hypothetical protein
MKLDEVLSGLAPFQRAAVDHAFHRLFVAPDGSRRFLVADEVGLGKTVIARGVVARAVKHLKTRVKRVDVVYICSNLGIARQNLNRLNPFPDQEFANAERITLLPLRLSDSRKGAMNLIAFTPRTSLDLAGNLGTATERRLLYVLLQKAWDLRGTGPLNVLQGNVEDTENFRARARELREEFNSQPEAAEFVASFKAALDGVPGLRKKFESLCDEFQRMRKHIPEEERRERNELVGQLRSVLARVCVGSLEPDLVILDEFQRFKELLVPDSEAGELARQLFDWSDGHERAHVLLLSATPYKPYTLQQESQDESHYTDFLKTVEFLFKDPKKTAAIALCMREFRRELLKGSALNVETLQIHRTRIEEGLIKVMSRTERVTAVGDEMSMHRSMEHGDLCIEAEDLPGYVELRALSDALQSPDPMEYWKSAPYALQFMENYRLSEQLRDQVGSRADERVLALMGRVSRSLTSLATGDRGDIKYPNAKLRMLLDDISVRGGFDVLWLPPSLPTYRGSSTFEHARERGLTKRLIFSSWNVAPRTIAALLSHESERRLQIPDIGGSEAPLEKGGLLKFSIDEGRPSGMPALALVYPARVLSSLCDPREFVRATGRCDLSLPEILAWAMERIRSVLPGGISTVSAGQSADESWYWALPIILDSNADPKSTKRWWQQESLAAIWAGEEALDEEHAETDHGWQEHVALAAAVAQGKHRPKGPAPADLIEVMALFGVAGAGACARRAFSTLLAHDHQAHALIVANAAAQAAWSIRRMLNRPQSTMLIRAGDRTKPYWRLALAYCANGCLDAVMCEYVNVLRDSTGSASRPAEEMCDEINRALAEALGVRASTIYADDFRVTAKGKRLEASKIAMRALFALRFGSDRAEDKAQVMRESAVRGAFNSPFWPFVLASTSVGQEGLDFHWYCHAIVHWNLPSNPVDLEQREGRVHRYRGHAIRKNVARTHGLAALKSSQPNPWEAAFKIAASEPRNLRRGLVPNWLYPIPDGAVIERHVPLYAMSRDEARYRLLKKELGAYRLVFGQPRQEELLAFLMSRIEGPRLLQIAEQLRINLSPPAEGEL